MKKLFLIQFLLLTSGTSFGATIGEAICLAGVTADRPIPTHGWSAYKDFCRGMSEAQAICVAGAVKGRKIQSSGWENYRTLCEDVDKSEAICLSGIVQKRDISGQSWYSYKEFCEDVKEPQAICLSGVVADRTLSSSSWDRFKQLCQGLTGPQAICFAGVVKGRKIAGASWHSYKEFCTDGLGDADEPPPSKKSVKEALEVLNDISVVMKEHKNSVSKDDIFTVRKGPQRTYSIMTAISPNKTCNYARLQVDFHDVTSADVLYDDLKGECAPDWQGGEVERNIAMMSGLKKFVENNAEAADHIARKSTVFHFDGELKMSIGSVEGFKDFVFGAEGEVVGMRQRK